MGVSLAWMRCQNQDSQDSGIFWIPAFAGMTVVGAGMTVVGAGMAAGDLGLNPDGALKAEREHERAT
jgi:hypothetical protein